MVERMDRASETETVVTRDWANGPWRKILPGENVDPKHKSVAPNGEISVPVRIYGLRRTEEPAPHQPLPMAKETQPAIGVNHLRLSRGAARVVQEAQSLGIDPTSALATASATHDGSKICVKRDGPLAGLKAAVNMARTTRG